MRWLDRIGGIAVLNMIATTRRRRPLPLYPQRIGIITPTAIGDTILSSGVIAALTARYPSADIIVFHGPTNAAAVALIPLQMTRVQCRFTHLRATLTALRSYHLDMVIDLTPWTRLTAIYARLSAPVAIGFDPPGQHRGKAFDIAVPHHRDSHELDNHARLAALFGDRPYDMNITGRRWENTHALPLEHLILCHTSASGARAADKAWPPENWAELARRLSAEGWQIAFTGTAADAASVDAILARAGLPSHRAVSLCGKIPLGQLGDVLRQVALLITIDTGVLHLASAVGGTILGLHGPTRSSRWGARSARATSLDSTHPSAGYIVYGYETNPHGHETMCAHSVEEVACAALAKLKADRPAPLGRMAPAGSFYSG